MILCLTAFTACNRVKEVDGPKVTPDTESYLSLSVGAESKGAAYDFVRKYKKMKLVDYHVIDGKFVRKNNEYKLYTSELDQIKGTKCYVVARKCVELNPKVMYA